MGANTVDKKSTFFVVFKISVRPCEPPLSALTTCACHLVRDETLHQAIAFQFGAKKRSSTLSLRRLPRLQLCSCRWDARLEDRCGIIESPG